MYLSFANLKLLVIIINDLGGGSGGTSEGDPLGLGGQFYGPLAADCIARIETG